MNENVVENIDDYFSGDAGVVAVYLFGSYSAGRATDSSDIDLAVLLETDSFKNAERLRQRYITELARRVRKDVHLVFLNSAGEELLRQIFLDGKCITINNPHKLAHFKTHAISNIAEYGYYRKKMQSGFVRKVMER